MSRRNLILLLAGIVFIGCDIAILTWYFTRKPEYKEPPLTFDGSSDQLQHTIIVPTLDTPIPEGKNAIWCASFQMAWNKLKTDVAKGPVQIQGAEEIAKRLNDSPVTEGDLPEGSYYAAAGLVKDGIAEKIQGDMKNRFRRTSEPRIPIHDDLVLVAYGYLESAMKYDVPFFDEPDGLNFKDAAGTESRLLAFGLGPGRGNLYDKLRQQITVLFADDEDEEKVLDSNASEFAIDPCVTSHPNQLTLACIHRKPCLADLLDTVDKRSEQARAGKENTTFHGRSTLLVPVAHWRLDHHFAELEGMDRQLSYPGSPRGAFVGLAAQSVYFKMDRAGVELRSEFTLIGAKSQRTDFHFNRPFLIVLKKRDAKNPFFVMWVDNAELLQKWGE